MGLSPESRARFNLERASVLVLDESPMGMSILVQILTGFGVKTLHRCEKVEEAKDVISKVEIDLIVCDEAHRTTGATFEGDDESAFVRVHDASDIRAAKRLYMTATPRIYGDSAKAVAERDNVALYSMDNEAWYGKQLFRIRQD